MTVSTATSFNSYAGNGSTTSFAYAFKIFQDSNLVVTLVNDTTGVETTQTLTTDYTVTGAGSDSGGNVVFVTAPALGNTVVIRRVLPVTQETNYVPNDPFPAEAHEDALDKLTMLVQQEVASSELAVQFPEGDVGSGINNILPSVTGRSDKLLKFGLDGGVEVIAASDLSNAIIGANYAVDTFTGTGSTTVYTLSSEPGSKANTAIYIDGVYQAKANYSVSGSTLTFTTAPPLNSAIEIVIGDAIPAGAATTASAVSYTQGGTGAVTTNVQAKLRETVSVKDFGAVGDGVADDTAAIQAALDVGGRIYFPTGTYQCNTVTVSNAVYIDFNGSTLRRATSGTKKIFDHSSGNMTMRNGIVDGQNTGIDRGMLIEFEDSNATLTLQNMTFQNNCLGYPTPTINQDTDHVYVLAAAALYVDSCRFITCSRNGISLVSTTPTVKITNSVFENCYLFGIDFEPNSAANDMYENVVITGNTFKNNGNHSASDAVWATSGNGPIQFAPYGGDTTKLIATNVTFSDNIVISEYNPASPTVAPLIKLNQIRSLVVNNNVINDIGSIQLMASQTTEGYSMIATGNKFEGDVTSGGDIATVIFDGNDARHFIANGVTSTIVSNTFNNPQDSDNVCIKFGSDVGHANISSNHFKDATYAIWTTSKNDNLTIANNTLGSGVTLFNASLDTSTTVTGNTGGLILASELLSSQTTASFSSGSAQTVLDLSGKNTAGHIAVIDPAGTRVGSFAMFGSFYDGSTTTPFLTNVQDSGLSGSALTLSGNNIQFAHSFGSTRTLTINIAYYFND